ncbi:PopZ family protein [Pannonibacter tanglangensis]|nr:MULTISPECIES: DUF2497 domain-containing protein [unclassified Pannonibacter]
MEEILASIRRIISDEEAPAAKKAAPEPVEEEIDDAFEAAEAEEDVSMSQDDLDKLFDMGGDDLDESPDDVAFAEAAEEEEDVLELTEDFAVEEDEGDEAFDMVDGMAETVDDDSGDVAFAMDDEPEPEPAPVVAAKPVAKAEPVRKPVVETRPVDMDRLDDLDEAAPLTSEGTGAAVHAAFENLSTTILSANARTLEDLVTDMLRPMLKNWLDQNLPVLVEQLVRQEIERVTRRR